MALQRAVYRPRDAEHTVLHNFTNAERYRAELAKDAWAKMLGFLDRQVKGAPATVPRPG